MEMADLKSMQLLFDICNEHKVVTWQDELERIVKVAKFRLDMAKLLPIRGRHYAVEPGQALCNANQPNQNATNIPKQVTCNKCNKKLKKLPIDAALSSKIGIGGYASFEEDGKTIKEFNWGHVSIMPKRYKELEQ